MFWAKQVLVDVKIEHNFCYCQFKTIIIFSSFRETYSVLIRQTGKFALRKGFLPCALLDPWLSAYAHF